MPGSYCDACMNHGCVCPPRAIHAGNRYTKGPPPYVEAKQLELPLEPPVSSDATEYRNGRRVESSQEYWTRQDNIALARAGQKVEPEFIDWAEGREHDPPMIGNCVLGGPNPKTLMGRKRLPFSSVVPMPALLRVAEAMQFGAFESPRADGGKGYGPYNWRDQDVEAMTYIDACDRHKARWVEGQEIDPKSLAMELAHAAASLIVLIDAIENGTWIDNRPTTRSCAASRILDSYEERKS